MTEHSHITVNGRRIGPGEPVYMVAEMSANHHQNFDRAVEIIEAAKAAGADAVKLQTYTPDTVTIDCDLKHFKIGKGSIWQGRRLYELYAEAHMPWLWQGELKKHADRLGIDLFSTPLDATAVDFLEEIDVPAYKVASFENVDLPLLRKIARTGKPIMMSTGMATLGELDEAVRTLRDAGGQQLALLKCVSAYPAPPQEMNLRTIAHLAEAFGTPVGLSDHTLQPAVSVAAVTLGACIIEKHFTISRATPGPDSSFSIEPDEFRRLVEAVRVAEKAIGQVRYGATQHETASRALRRSLFVVANVNAGELFTSDNVRVIRPGHGLHSRHLEAVLGKRAAKHIHRGTPLRWDLVSG